MSANPAPAQAEQEDDSSPSAPMVFGHSTIQAMDNTQVDHRIESMVIDEETNLDEHGRMKNTPSKSYYEAKKDKFQLFCNTVYCGMKKGQNQLFSTIQMSGNEYLL